MASSEMLFPQFSLSLCFPLHCTVIPFAERLLMNKNGQISAWSKIFLAKCSRDQRPNPAEIFLRASRSCVFHISLKLMRFLKHTLPFLFTVDFTAWDGPSAWMVPVVQ